MHFDFAYETDFRFRLWITKQNIWWINIRPRTFNDNMSSQAAIMITVNKKSTNETTPIQLKNEVYVKKKPPSIVDIVGINRKKSRNYTQTIFSSTSYFWQYWVYATTSGQKSVIEISTGMATKWGANVANSATAMKHKRWKWINTSKYCYRYHTTCRLRMYYPFIPIITKLGSWTTSMRHTINITIFVHLRQKELQFELWTRHILSSI